MKILIFEEAKPGGFRCKRDPLVCYLLEQT